MPLRFTEYSCSNSQEMVRVLALRRRDLDAVAHHLPQLLSDAVAMAFRALEVSHMLPRVAQDKHSKLLSEDSMHLATLTL